MQTEPNSMYFLKAPLLERIHISRRPHLTLKMSFIFDEMLEADFTRLHHECQINQTIYILVGTLAELKFHKLNA